MIPSVLRSRSRPGQASASALSGDGVSRDRGSTRRIGELVVQREKHQHHAALLRQRRIIPDEVQRYTRPSRGAVTFLTTADCEIDARMAGSSSCRVMIALPMRATGKGSVGA